MILALKNISKLLLVCGCIFLLSSHNGYAAIKISADLPGLTADVTEVANPYLFIAQAKNKENKKSPRSGTLVLPINAEQEKNQTKKCMTVCSRWGEDCMIDPIRGRKCRRTCKEFSEECF